MSDFDSLTLALEGWFDTLLCDLPDALRQRVEEDFSPMPWDNLSADQRRTGVLQWDYQHDPATEQDRQFWWDFFVRQSALEKQVAQWEAVSTPTAGDLAQKETRLAELRQELTRMEQQQRQARGDYSPERKRPDGAEGQSSNVKTLPERYIAYPKAMKRLAERLKATPEELAAWVFIGTKADRLNVPDLRYLPSKKKKPMPGELEELAVLAQMGPKDCGVAAYLNANELDPPPRFHYGFGIGSENDFDYLSPLMACWFREDDIARFEPANRFITGKALIERWSVQPGIQPEAFIRAKIAESRLLPLHPIYGGTQGIFPGDANFPPLESGLFALSGVKDIEAEDFGDKDVQSESSVSPCQPVGAGEIRHQFRVIRDEDGNEKWWNVRMADADRYGLLDCRVGQGKKGQRGGSLWRPDLIAVWLVDRLAKGHAGLSSDAARAALKRFPGCEEAADDLLPPDK